MTYEEYQGKQEQWINRPYHHTDGQCYLPISKISIPDYIKGTSTGEIIIVQGKLLKRMERGWMMDPRYSDSAQVMPFWYFTDDLTHTPIDIEQWPGPCLLSRSL